MKQNSFLVGTPIYAAQGDGYRRQCNAFETWRNLNVPLINLAFTDAPSCNAPGFEEVLCLERDSNTITGCDGARKPLMNDLFDGLCRAARERNMDYFVFSNADIQLTPHFGQLVASTDLDSLIFTRLDYTSAPASDDAQLFYPGQDTYAVRTDWWMENRHYFKPYIIGEALWDNVYTAIFARRGRSAILYGKDLCFHERHEQRWNPKSNFGLHNETLRLRYDYLDYALVREYLTEIQAADKQSPTFPALQKKLWESLCREKPALRWHAKRFVAIALSFVVQQQLRANRKKKVRAPHSQS